jgi:hypothetical protein
MFSKLSYHKALFFMFTLLINTFPSPPGRAEPQAGWFARFPSFDYNPNAKVSDEFKRLGAQRRWKSGTRTWRRKWRECWNYEYDRLIGHQAASLATWQQMCAKLCLDASLGSINKCKRVRIITD